MAPIRKADPKTKPQAPRSKPTTKVRTELRTKVLLKQFAIQAKEQAALEPPPKARWEGSKNLTPVTKLAIPLSQQEQAGKNSSRINIKPQYLVHAPPNSLYFAYPCEEVLRWMGQVSGVAQETTEAFNTYAQVHRTTQKFERASSANYATGLALPPMLSGGAGIDVGGAGADAGAGGHIPLPLLADSADKDINDLDFDMFYSNLDSPAARKKRLERQRGEKEARRQRALQGKRDEVARADRLRENPYAEFDEAVRVGVAADFQETLPFEAEGECEGDIASSPAKKANPKKRPRGIETDNEDKRFVAAYKPENKRQKLSEEHVETSKVAPKKRKRGMETDLEGDNVTTTYKPEKKRLKSNSSNSEDDTKKTGAQKPAQKKIRQERPIEKAEIVEKDFGTVNNSVNYAAANDTITTNNYVSNHFHFVVADAGTLIDHRALALGLRSRAAPARQEALQESDDDGSEVSTTGGKKCKASTRKGIGKAQKANN